MAGKKRHWLWNTLIVLTVIVCLMAFAAHYKNWTRIEPDKMTILSGIYYHNLAFKDLNQVEWVDKIPPMVRLNGFSAFEKGKGVYQEFKDTLTDRKVYVFVDNFENQKIRLVNKDSSQLFLNMKDSLETVEMFKFFKGKIELQNKMSEGN
ncbi:hypothetical protein FEE95_04405 [Maribacter algarum]|uniref:Uncharacterized protein n=1 Tax=Maribacter algarum (ex Zhang et al. 2020) TaxID=2578118 RepID=A0A5S3PZD2_9FLAO|nr:hypothetical protein [Maribacter algarum]TMM58677.1 hypothetical protein FEE95_04405 [Maribacter algarum]